MIRDLLRYAGILAVICFVASGLLAGVNALTKPRIIAQAYADEQAALTEVLPQAQEFVPVTADEETFYYKGLSAGGDPVGYAFKAEGKGYAGVIETMVGMTPAGEIITVKVMNQNETPGLGNRVAQEEFSSRFTSQNAVGLQDVQAITGATISSRAVIDSVKRKAADVLKHTQQ